MRSPFRWAFMMVLALVGVAGAQITPPQTASFSVKEFSWKNDRGNAISTVTINNMRLDTLPELSVRAILQDTVVDSTHTVWGITISRPGYPNYTERDTLSIVQQMHLPLKSSASYLPDSLFSVIPVISSPVIGSEMTIKLQAVDPDQGYFIPVVFASDTVRGTATDTSDAIYLGRGIKEATFGFTSSVETAEVTYEVLYNLGQGWGFAVPSDTLAGKTQTDDVPQNYWGYFNYGALLNSTFCKVVRRGEAEADTGYVRQSIRLSPR